MKSSTCLIGTLSCFIFASLPSRAESVAPATPEAAAEWARTLPMNARMQALQGIVAAWAEVDPVAAAKWAKNLTGDEMWVFSSIAGAWVEKDPLAASAWVLEMPEGPQRVRSLESLGQAWGVKSRSDALAWAEKIQTDLDRQAAVGGVIQSWAMQDSAAALKYAEGQTDMKSKEQLLGKVLYGWCFRDRPAAEKWVKELAEGDLKKAMELLSLSTQSHGAVRTTEDAMAKQYEFWSTQPVPKISKLASLF